MERRSRLIRGEAERLQQNAPHAPIIAAGSTGSIPATAELLKATAGLEQGAVVLPGLDCHIGRCELECTQPQHTAAIRAEAALLDSWHLDRSE